MSKPIHILLVDDDQGFIDVQRELLLEAGYRVTTAADGQEAIWRLAEDDDIDVVVIDLIMPEKEGLETIGEIRRRWPRTRTVAMSGGGRNSQHDYLKVAKLLGASRILAKPFSFTELTATIAAVVPSTDRA